MGEPAIPSYDERRWLRAFARSVVDAVRDDEEQPTPRFADGDAMDDGTMIFMLAQELELLLEPAEEDLTANQLDALELTFTIPEPCDRTALQKAILALCAEVRRRRVRENQ